MGIVNSRKIISYNYVIRNINTNNDLKLSHDSLNSVYKDNEKKRIYVLFYDIINRYEKKYKKITKKANKGQFKQYIIGYECHEDKTQPPMRKVISKLNKNYDVKFVCYKNKYLIDKYNQSNQNLNVYTVYVIWK